MSERRNPTPDPEELWLSAEPVQGWKVARPCYRLGSAVFAGVTSDLTYGTHDVASCHRQPDHVAPAPRCACGFYAWRYRQLATPLLWATSPALLEVELFGRFEYAFGYVAAGQHVRRVHLLPVCSECLMRGKRRDAVALNATHGGPSWVLPCCGDHASPRATDVTVLSRRLGIEVLWLELTPALDFHLALAQLMADLPVRYPMGRLCDLRVGDIGFVFQDHLRIDIGGTLRIGLDAPLIQPMPGTDVPIRRRPDGDIEVLAEGIRLPVSGWKPSACDRTVPVEAIGDPVIDEIGEEVGADVR